MSEVSQEKYRIHLIVEGNEEEYLFDIVKELGVSEAFELTYENACGFGNVASLYQRAMFLEDYDCVLCVYDVDYRQNEKGSPYNCIVEQLTLVLGEVSEVKSISFCTNPNILQWLLLGCDSFGKVALQNASKTANTPIVHKYWDKIGRIRDGEKKTSAYYDARQWQLEIIKNSYLYDEEPSYNYETLLSNGQSVPNDYLSNTPGSNLLKLLEALKEGDVPFFESIISKLGQ